MPYLSDASPPSPEFDLAPKAFIASAKVSWALGDIAPKLIPAESNLVKIFFSDSTFLRSIFMLFELTSSKSLSIAGGLESTR